MGSKVERLKLKKRGRSHKHPIDDESFDVYYLGSLPCVSLLKPMDNPEDKKSKRPKELIAVNRYAEFTMLPIPRGMSRLAKGGTHQEFIHPAPLVALNPNQDSGLLFLLHRLSDTKKEWKSHDDVEIRDFCNPYSVLDAIGVDNPCAYPVKATDGSKSYFEVVWDWDTATKNLPSRGGVSLHNKLTSKYFANYGQPTVKMVAATTPNRTIIWIPVPQNHQDPPHEALQIAAQQHPNNTSDECFSIYHPTYLDGPNIWIGKLDDKPW